MAEWVDTHRPRLRTHGRGSSKMVPDELIWEILSYLPAKPLMRFKCVSKIWQSIITDPSFARGHRAALRGLLLSDPSGVGAPTTSFFYLNIDGPSSQIRHYLTVFHGGGGGGGDYYGGYSNVVNGLVCFYHGNFACLYNIATRERLNLPESVQYVNDHPIYHLGFDPISKLYKVLKIWIQAEILTVGVDSSWRPLGFQSFLSKLSTQSACLDGVLCWEELTKGQSGNYPLAVLRNYDLIAFHLADEKFQMVPLPRIKGRKNSLYLPQFGTNLDLIHSVGKEMLVKRYTRVHGNGGKSKGVWTDEQKSTHAMLPAFIPQGILSNGKILMFDRRGVAKKASAFNIYLFDQTNGELETIVVAGTTILVLHEGAGLQDYCMAAQKSYYEENIMPLRCLNSSH